MSGAEWAPVPDGAGDPADPGPAINALATDVARRLATLREQLEPTRARWADSHDYLDPAEEWAIATDGLLGPTGVLGIISDAVRITLPDLVGTRWSERTSGLSAGHGGSAAGGD
ncbi:hypothetical protein ACLQ29_17140 [Micromonospora sp. DT228]|uniref:hypothetical protein n=1 Tax=unclassified Micromonospora TaxID=2617518 RepID=UPI00371AC8EF